MSQKVSDQGFQPRGNQRRISPLSLLLLNFSMIAMQVTLISADRQKFEVDIEVAKMSQTIKDMVEGE